jgi:4-hydroxy-2-oxoglutarate aldolase
MTEPVDLGGIGPPIPTPFDRRGEVAHRALAENLTRWGQYGLRGYVVLGSNGEAVYLSREEKLNVLKTARETIPTDRIFVAGTGCESVRETIALTAEAARIGADVALVISPHFYRMTAENLVSYYHAVADAAPIPVVLYNVPKFTHLEMDAATIARAAEHPNIIGIKDSGGNITKIADTVRRTSGEFQVLAGSAGFLLAGLTLGAVGGVLALANVAPQQAIDIYELFRQGKGDEAAELQRQMIPVNAAITAQFGVPGLKAALDMLGWYGGPVRSPLLDLDGAERSVLREILEAGGVL